MFIIVTHTAALLQQNVLDILVIQNAEIVEMK